MRASEAHMCARRGACARMCAHVCASGAHMRAGGAHMRASGARMAHPVHHMAHLVHHMAHVRAARVEKVRGFAWLSVAQPESVRHVAAFGVAQRGSAWLTHFAAELAVRLN